MKTKTNNNDLVLRFVEKIFTNISKHLQDTRIDVGLTTSSDLSFNQIIGKMRALSHGFEVVRKPLGKFSLGPANINKINIELLFSVPIGCKCKHYQI